MIIFMIGIGIDIDCDCEGMGKEIGLQLRYICYPKAAEGVADTYRFRTAKVVRGQHPFPDPGARTQEVAAVDPVQQP